MFGLSRKQENLLAEYKAIISDLRDQLRDRDQLVSELTDKVIALSSPATLREVRRPPSTPPAPTKASGNSQNQRRRIHWPGMRTNLRPPSPVSPPGSESSLGDAERLAVLNAAEVADGD